MEEIIKTLLLEGIDEDTIHRVLDVIEEEYNIIEAREADIEASVFPKKALAVANKKYEEADKEATAANRIARTALKKLNKKVKHLKDVGWNEDDRLSHIAHSQEGTRYEKAKKNYQEADNKLTKLERKQDKLVTQGVKGVSYRPIKMHRTKKGDNYSFHKDHIQTSESQQ